MTIRRPRNLVCQPLCCYRTPKPGHRPKPFAYGNVWMEVLHTSKNIPASELAAAKRQIGKSIKRDKLTFARWFVGTEYRVEYRAYLTLISADVVFDDAYEKAQVP